jgi:hypothetical protein
LFSPSFFFSILFFIHIIFFPLLIVTSKMNATSRFHAERNLAALQESHFSDICAEYTLKVLPLLDVPNAFSTPPDALPKSATWSGVPSQIGQTHLSDFGIVAVVAKDREGSWEKLCIMEADFWTRHKTELSQVPNWKRAMPPPLPRRMRAQRRDCPTISTSHSSRLVRKDHGDPSGAGGDPGSPGSCDDRERDADYQTPWNMDGISRCRPPGYTYKRMNHFNAVLGAYQGKRRMSRVPASVMDGIAARARLMQCPPSPSSILAILKEMKKPKYYQYPVAIAMHLQPGVGAEDESPPISKAMEMALKERFRLVEDAYDSCRVQERKNFLSYPYVLRKLLELENTPEAFWVVQMLPITKNKLRIRNQDAIWEMVCSKLRWRFVPTSV